MKKILVSFFIFCFAIPALAQEPDENKSIFQAAAIIGFNATQVDGDAIAGYRKIGANIGGAAYITLPKNFSFNFEILYSQKGSRTNSHEDLAGAYRFESFKIILDYVDVPLLFNYHDKDGSGKEIAVFGLGVVFNSLVRNKTLVAGIEDDAEAEAYKRFGAEAVANVIFRFAKRFGANIRFTYSLTNIRSTPFHISSLKNGGQRNNVLTVRAMYFF